LLAEVENVHQLGDGAFSIAGLNLLHDAVFEVIFERDPADVVERAPHGRDLFDDLDSIRIVFDEPDDAQNGREPS
jgi:hypothetical protein